MYTGEQSLFSHEISRLEEMRQYLTSGSHDVAGMRECLTLMADEYAKLLKTMQKIVRISDSQAREIKRRESELHLLLDNANQGFFSFGRNWLVNKEYSQECLRIFGHRISNRNVCNLLADGDKALESTLQSSFQKLFDLKNDVSDLGQYALPDSIQVRDRIVLLQAKHVESGHKSDDDFIMVILTDITDTKNAQEQIIYLSYHDPLTGLKNRAYLDHILPYLQKTDHLPLSIIMGDMNALKLTNDVFGHTSGDQLLKNMANVLRICSRDDDVLVRWGGDEYLILLPRTDNNQADKIADRIQKLCHEYRWDPIELSIALGTATQFAPEVPFGELFNVAERRMYNNKTRMADHFLESLLSGFEKILANQCDESRVHAANIADLACRLFEASASAEGDVNVLRLAARLHDIGKVSIDKYLFDGRSPLNAQEWEIIKTHSEAGYRTVKALNQHHLARIILSIHEHWDGKGYPQQLKGVEIPLESRIIAIAETYDVLTRGKHYKNNVSVDAALKVISENAGSQFDPHLVEKFVAMIQED